MLGALWGLLLGILTAVGVVLFWPIRAMLRKRKAKKEGATATAETAAKNEAAEDDAGETAQS